MDCRRNNLMIATTLICSGSNPTFVAASMNEQLQLLQDKIEHNKNMVLCTCAWFKVGSKNSSEYQCVLINDTTLINKIFRCYL